MCMKVSSGDPLNKEKEDNKEGGCQMDTERGGRKVVRSGKAE